MNKSRLLSSKIVYKGFFNVREDQLQIKDIFTYASIETRADAVLILGVTPDKKYVLTQEYRYPVRETLLSIAGGYIDAEETLEETAARELLEETGFVATSYKLLGSAYPYAGISTQKIYYVLAENAVQMQVPATEPNEQIEILTMSHSELLEKIKSDTPVDSNLYTILFLLSAKA